MAFLSKTKSFPVCGTDIRRGKTTFSQLVKDLEYALGPSTDLCSNDIDLNHILELMSLYTSSEPEWTRYAFKNTAGPYARNLVDEGNGRSNLLIMVWNPSGTSPIHDHARAHCVMKILKGSLKESLYEMPREGPRSPPRLVKEVYYAENQVTHISDQIGIHKISNPSATEFAVSLHLYTPPYAANFGFHVFDEATGEPKHITKATLTSDRGVELKK